ncbi:uncharacterized protein K02A2.6-like [Saccostrea cucullata]|uniref:uncharacterized protein K02A2.6-like n=1 Tax=Saccostrea cuccullata TaxID=36930 RepID=UPI002ED2F5A8
MNETKEQLMPDIEINSISYLPMSPEQYERFQQATHDDPELQTLQAVVKSGWPNTKDSIPNSTYPYWPFRDEITCIDGLMFKGQKIIVPSTLRKEMLDRIHSSHLGTVKCKSRARETLYWPGMTSSIQEVVERCSICALNSKSNPKEPMLETETPSRPWSIISTNLFDFKGHSYLVCVDHFSKWPEFAKLENQTSDNTILHLKGIFSRIGIPDKLISDNGPQFASANFREFAKDYGFVHKTTSPHFPQANGQIERTVQTVKQLLRKSTDPYKAILAYRNTAIDMLGKSPAQLFFNRRLKTDLPVASPLLEPNSVGMQEVQERLKTRKYQQKLYYDAHAGKELRDLYPGETTVMRHDNKWTPAVVVQQHSSPRSYILQAQSGKRYRRNRRHIRPTSATFPDKPEVDEPILPPPSEKSNEPFQSNAGQTAIEKPSQEVEPSNPTISVPSTTCTRSGRNVVCPSKFKDFVK